MRNSPIVITGIGAVTPLGNELPQIFESLAQQRTRFRPMQHPKSGRNELYFGLLPHEYLSLEKSYYNKRTIKQTILNTRVSCICSQLALRSAQLDLKALPRDRIGILLGTSGASIRDPEEYAPPGSAKFKIIREMTNASSAWVSLEHGITGPAFNLSAAGSSGAYAIMQACELIKAGVIDIAIAGGTDISSTWESIDFALENSLISKKYAETHKLKPFDCQADGTLLADGGAVLILQSEQSAQQTKSKSYAKIKGFFKNYDLKAVQHLEHSSQSYASTMHTALKNARCAPDDIQMVCANALSHIHFDTHEGIAIKSIFSSSKNDVHTTSFKPFIGYCIGGASSVDIALSAYALYTNHFPKLHSDTTQEPSNTILLYDDKISSISINQVLVNSFSLAGHNCSCILSK